MIDVKLDIHTHTVASGHAFSTMQEMAQAAAERGLEILGITEHAPTIPGSCNEIYFHNLPVIPRQMYGVQIMLGSELNILDTDGTLDLEPFHYRRMDLRIAGIHSFCWKGGTIEENTAGVVSAMRNPWVQMITHPGDGTASLDMGKLVEASIETGTILEINNHSLNPFRHKVDARANNLEILRLCKKRDVPVMLGSDAHISFSIADYANIYPLLEETAFPNELILNDKPDLFLKILKAMPE